MPEWVVRQALEVISSHRRPLGPVRSSSDSSYVFPRYTNLLVTTAQGVFVWNRESTTQVLKSVSCGIAAARAVTSGAKPILAVADRQVIVLHDSMREHEQDCKLQHSEHQGEVRLLHHQKHVNRLYFTTTLQNSVQCYSIEHCDLLEPSHPHPSPPTVFAVSKDSTYIVSASTKPPLIYLEAKGCQKSRILVQPEVSSSSVVAANFHPIEDYIFVLAFADGSIAAYDASRLCGLDEEQRSLTIDGNRIEIASCQNVHTLGSPAFAEDPSFCGYQNQAATSNPISPRSCIPAVAFLPYGDCTIVSVGSDGKCIISTFRPERSRSLESLRSWNIGAAATSLAILPQSKYLWRSELPTDQIREWWTLKNTEATLAIGREDGVVSIYDIRGLLLSEHTFLHELPPESQIIQVEWLQGGLSKPVNGETDATKQSRRGSIHIEDVSHVSLESLGRVKQGIVAESRARNRSAPQCDGGSDAPRNCVSEDKARRAHLQPISSSSTTYNMRLNRKSQRGSAERGPKPTPLTAPRFTIAKEDKITAQPNRRVATKHGKTRKAKRGSYIQTVPLSITTAELKRLSLRADEFAGTVSMHSKPKSQTSSIRSCSDARPRISSPISWKRQHLSQDGEWLETSSPLQRSPNATRGEAQTATMSNEDDLHREAPVSPTAANPLRPHERLDSLGHFPPTPTSVSNNTIIDWIATYKQPTSPKDSKGDPRKLTSPVPPPKSRFRILQSEDNDSVASSNDTIIEWPSTVQRQQNPVAGSSTLNPVNIARTPGQVNFTPHESTMIAMVQPTVSSTDPPPNTIINPTAPLPPPSLSDAPPLPSHIPAHTYFTTHPVLDMPTHPPPRPISRPFTIHPILRNELSNINKRLMEEIAALRIEMKEKFSAQKNRFDADQRRQEAELRKLLEENRELRGELRRVEKGADEIRRKKGKEKEVINPPEASRVQSAESSGDI
ncbi:hypothetical protein MMC25_006434 [Agyrium rufum]|nr:hypothetical protein [Agyrium rufum]